jgi:dihydrofolate reductase
MGKVILELSVSLDGFAAGADVGVDNPLGVDGEHLHDWMFGTATETGKKVAEEMFATAGAIVLGRRMYDLGKQYWDPDPNTFRRLPVFVLTHRAQDPVADPGGSTFTFVTGGVEEALAQARAAAGDGDVVLGGGPGTDRPFLAAGLVDELRIHLVHRLLGAGTRLFEPGTGGPTTFRATSVVEDAGVTHFRFVPADLS